MQDFKWKQFDCFVLGSERKNDANQLIPSMIGKQQQSSS